MSLFPIQLDSDLQSSFADIASYLLGKDEPPLKYDKSYPPTSGNSSGQDAEGAQEYNQISKNLIKSICSIMEMPSSVMPLLIKDLRAALHQESSDNIGFIMTMFSVIYNICKEMYPRDKGSSTRHKIGNLQLTEPLESTTNNKRFRRNTTSARFHVQEDQDVMENQPPTTKSLTPTYTISLRKRDQTSIAPLHTTMPKNKRNVQDVIVVSETLTSKDSEPSSPSTSFSSNNALTEDAIEDSESTNQMLYQSLNKFIQEARQKVEKFSSSISPDKTEVKVINLVQNGKNKEGWTSGLELLSNIESAQDIMDCVYTQYAKAAMTFTRWHESQVNLTVERLQPTEAALRKASGSVTSELIYRKLAIDPGKSSEDQLRKNINTYLTRGRKWHRLVRAFGFGILFFDPWSLAKTKNQELDLLIAKLQADLDKMVIFKGLEEQINNLFKKKRTNKQQFDEYLRGKNYLAAEKKKSTDLELNELYDEVIRSSTCNHLVIRETEHTFDKKSLLSLKPCTWLEGNIITACLYLSRKLDFMRI
ncbi:hypothetical protein GGI35DRAFT_492717 [Trichoderma velutinum]